MTKKFDLKYNPKDEINEVEPTYNYNEYENLQVQSGSPLVSDDEMENVTDYLTQEYKKQHAEPDVFNNVGEFETDWEEIWSDNVDKPNLFFINLNSLAGLKLQNNLQTKDVDKVIPFSMCSVGRLYFTDKSFDKVLKNIE